MILHSNDGSLRKRRRTWNREKFVDSFYTISINVKSFCSRHVLVLTMKGTKTAGLKSIPDDRVLFFQQQQEKEQTNQSWLEQSKELMRHHTGWCGPDSNSSILWLTSLMHYKGMTCLMDGNQSDHPGSIRPTKEHTIRSDSH